MKFKRLVRLEFESVWRETAVRSSGQRLMPAGALPYSALEGHGWLDGLYWASSTVTTVGFSDAHPTHLWPGIAGVIFQADIFSLKKN